MDHLDVTHPTHYCILALLLWVFEASKLLELTVYTHQDE